LNIFQHDQYLIKYKEECRIVKRLALQQHICICNNEHQGQWYVQRRKEGIWTSVCIRNFLFL